MTFRSVRHAEVFGFLAALGAVAPSAGCSDTSSGGWTPASPAPFVECVPPRPKVAPGPATPTIDLAGDAVIELPLDQPYLDAGATARNEVDGELTARLTVLGLDRIDVHHLGDYLVRYGVSSLDGTATSEAVRLVRVTDGHEPNRQTERFVASTSSPLGYFEHLPVDYARGGAAGFPLLIYNHGVGEAADWLEQDNDIYGNSPFHLDRLLRRGLARLLALGTWDDSLPFVVLAPQRCLLTVDVEVGELDDFVAYAERTYRIDPTRIYMVGFSAGSYMTWEYALRHPTRLAATAHLSGGDSEVAGCPLKDTPAWAFHARDDATVTLDEDVATISAINACAPKERDKLSVFPQGGHGIDEEVLTGAIMGQAESGFDPYDQTLYSWLLQHPR